jgi:two-component system sensor histidine kinase ChiS
VIAIRTLERGFHFQELFPDLHLWVSLKRIEFITAHIATPLFCWYLYDALPGLVRKRYVWMVTCATVPLALFTLVTPPRVFGWTAGPYQLATVITIVWVLYALAKGSRQDPTGAVRIVLFGVLVLGGCVIHDILVSRNLLFTPLITSMGQAVCILCQSLVLAIGNTRARRTAEELSVRLLHLDKLKNEFLANTSHELRTPLNAIINIPQGLLTQFEERSVVVCHGCGAILEPDGPLEEGTVCGVCEQPALALEERRFPPSDTDALASHLRSIIGSGEHLLRLVNDILDHSKLAAGRLDVDLRPIDLIDVVNRAVAQVLPLARTEGVELRVDVPLELRLEGDTQRLVQVLINLIANALKFSPPRGTVDISALRDGTDVLVRVTDRGPGIAPEHQEVIFESFRQIEGGHTRKHGGTGLGLAIVKQIVVLHGGTVHVDSALGKGATFVVRLPALLPTPAPQPLAAPAP